MPRIAQASIAKSLGSESSPRLVIVNSSTSVGRYPQMFRIRPTLLERARALTVGPMYLVLEHALEKLCAELEAMPDGTIRTLNAFNMDPSAQDREMHIPRRRSERTSRKELESENDGGDEVRGDREGQ